MSYIFIPDYFTHKIVICVYLFYCEATAIEILVQIIKKIFLVDSSILRGKNLKNYTRDVFRRNMVNFLLCERNTIYLKSKRGL